MTGFVLVILIFLGLTIFCIPAVIGLVLFFKRPKRKETPQIVIEIEDFS